MLRRLLPAMLCALAALLLLSVLAVPAYAEAPIAWGRIHIRGRGRRSRKPFSGSRARPAVS